MADIESNEELIELFRQLKQRLREETEEKEKLRLELGFNEQKKDWNKEYVNQLKQQLTQYKGCVDEQTNALRQYNRIKEENTKLNAKISELNLKIENKEKSNQELIEKIKSEMNSEIIELKKSLESNENVIQNLKLTLNSKDILLNQTKRDLSDCKTKNEENINEIKEFFETKIKNNYKDFDEKYQKCRQINDEKIIEIKANSLRTIDKTKEEFEKQLIKYQNENKELNEKYSHLRLEFEARKMSNQFINTNKTLSKSKPLNTTENKSKTSIRVLDSDTDQNPPKIQLIETKRKKLVQNNDSYLEYLRDEP